MPPVNDRAVITSNGNHVRIVAREADVENVRGVCNVPGRCTRACACVRVHARLCAHERVFARMCACAGICIRMRVRACVCARVSPVSSRVRACSVLLSHLRGFAPTGVGYLKRFTFLKSSAVATTPCRWWPARCDRCTPLISVPSLYTSVQLDGVGRCVLSRDT